LKAFFVGDFARNPSEFFKSLEKRAGFVAVNATGGPGLFSVDSGGTDCPDATRSMYRN
jgi:hypothetical protein